MVSTDNYFNLQLKNAEEFINDESKGVIGDIFIRCNNVLWIGEDLDGNVLSDNNTVTEKQ